jgi:Subtilase family
MQCENSSMPGSLQYILAMTLAATAATAQVRLPSVGLPTLPLQTLQQTLPQTLSQAQSLDALSGLRHLEINRLIHANRRLVDTDPDGEPIVRDEILGLSPSNDVLAKARSLGLTVDREQTIDAMSIRLVVFKGPQGMSTKKALRTLREADPGGSYDYNHIYMGGGAQPNGSGNTTGAQDTPPSSVPAHPDTQSHVRMGLLDTGVDVTHPVFHESIVHAWGCGNHPVAAAHGTAVASLLIGHSEVFKGVRPDAELYAADVYCGRATGGAVDALVAAFGWLVQEKVPVINVSLVGPKNTMLERVVDSLVASGYVIVAAVGNDGPAAPPLYPASYPHVVGVTAVDAHRHVIVEAAHGPQVMFASPGADLAAAAGDHAYAAVRGTSFAAPFVTALLASGMRVPDSSDAAAAIDALAKTAIDLGAPGRDLTYGFGLVGADYRIDPAPLIRR